MIKYILKILITSLIISNSFADERGLENITELRLLVGDMNPVGASNQRLFFAEFEGFTLLRDMIVNISKTSKVTLDEVTPLFEFEASLSGSGETDLVVEFGRTWMRVENNSYHINDRQYNRVLEFLSWRLTDEELKALTSNLD